MQHKHHTKGSSVKHHGGERNIGQPPKQDSSLSGRLHDGPEERHHYRDHLGTQNVSRAGSIDGGSSNSDAGAAASNPYSMWGSRASSVEQARKTGKGGPAGRYKPAHKNKYSKGQVGWVSSQSFNNVNGTDDVVPTVYGTAYAVLWQSREQLQLAPLINNRTRYSGESGVGYTAHATMAYSAPFFGQSST